MSAIWTAPLNVWLLTDHLQDIDLWGTEGKIIWSQRVSYNCNFRFSSITTAVIQKIGKKKQTWMFPSFG